MPILWGMDRRVCGMWYIHNKYYSAIKTEIMPFAAMLMDQEVITISKVSQTEKDKYHMISLTGRMLKKNDTN